MSTVKKLSLSGFKSTFKRKTNRGSSSKCTNTQQAQTVNRYACEKESCKTNGDYQHVGLKNGIAGRPSDDFINKNRDEDDIASLEIKTSRWGFRQKSGKSEICVNSNGGIDLVNANAPGDVKLIPGSGGNGDVAGDSYSSNSSQRPPLANGHVLVDVKSTNQNVKSGYVGARRSQVPPQLANGHAFLDSNGVNVGAHDYINDSRKTGGCINGDFPRKISAEGQTQSNIDTENITKVSNHYEIHQPISTMRGQNVEHDVNENDAEESEGSCFDMGNKNTFQKSISSETHGNEDIDDDPPPAIPPKPSKLFNNGQWTLDKDNATELENENENEIASEDRLPPRPPARSKTRCVIDTSLPFYKQYLEMKERTFQTPIYEDVKLEEGQNSGGLAGELSKLPRQPWYWGPMSQEEAEEKLADSADGSFLVRDSSDERYLLTLSFRSSGRTLHTRIEHRNGLFSLHDSEGHSSVIQLIHNAVRESQNGVYGYMNDSTGIQNFPARLTHWVSRYSEVKSLQYLCRFVIRETFPRHHIRKLPLPNKINEYILENQY